MLDLCLVFVRCPEGLNKKRIGSKLVQRGTKVVKKKVMRVPIGANVVSKPSQNDCHASAALVMGHLRAVEGGAGTLVWRAAKGRPCMILQIKYISLSKIVFIFFNTNVICYYVQESRKLHNESR